MSIEALIGVAVGVLTIVVARVICGQHWLYSLGLLVVVGAYLLWLSRRISNADLRQLAVPVPRSSRRE